MTHMYAPHLHLPHPSTRARHALDAAVTITVVVAAVGVAATQVDFGGNNDTSGPVTVLQHPGNVSPWHSFFADLTATQAPAPGTGACMAGAGLECLLSPAR